VGGRRVELRGNAEDDRRRHGELGEDGGGKQVEEGGPASRILFSLSLSLPLSLP